ncbi:serine/threonine-protein kinase [Streptomyces griseorubiginosus]|uniref:serine/threonine-protein kinase n=1 Tax=Streptomyces griseorubiginosus TaxID=67304 RepID=UPI00076C8630|nr:serine/threonine-protein kinase [Streptomyces griseorubiginosus]KUM76745.1 serine/threonine protein kinase [Streptomyces griseorubiginosus]
MPLHKDDPKSVGGYKVLDRLGTGGMGVVYRGRSRSGREVAVKVVHAQYAEDTVFRARFRQEIESVRKVSGAFTAPVVDADPEALRPWMATQYVPGLSLADRIRERGALKDTELRQLALGLVEALRDIHRAGVVHRDLKPANVLLAGDGPRVIDFGISRAAENHNTLTETGQMIGTPPFMSPEQFTDARTVGPASDVFSLGALLVYTLTGRGPFDADSPYLTAYQVVHDEPVLDGVGEELGTVLRSCLAKKAADRPELDEVARELARVLPEAAADDPPTVTSRGDLPDPADTGAPDPNSATSPGRRRRLRPLWAMTAAIGVLAIGLASYLLSGPGRTDDGEGGAARAKTAASRWTALPSGWQPWQTTVYATAPRGLKKGITLREASLDSGPECQMYEGALYCAGDAVLPVRLDGLTGRIDWRADGVPSLSEKRSYKFSLLGVTDDVMVVRQQYQLEGGNLVISVSALDTGTGKRLWHRTVDSDSSHLTVAGDLVLVPDIERGRLTARSARTGAERWTAPLPAGMQCDPTHANVGLYLECVPGMTPAKEILLLGFDRSDGSVRRVRVPPHSTLVGTYDGRLLYLEPAEEVPGHLSTGTKGPFSRIRLVDPDTGAATTTELAEKFEGTVTTAVGTLWFTGTSGRVTAVSVRTGKQLWQTPTSLEQPGAVTPGAGARVVYLSSASGRVAALDGSKGTLLWETLPRAKWVNSQSELPSQVLLNKGALVVTTQSGDVLTLDPAHPERNPG